MQLDEIQKAYMLLLIERSKKLNYEGNVITLWETEYEKQSSLKEYFGNDYYLKMCTKYGIVYTKCMKHLLNDL